MASSTPSAVVSSLPPHARTFRRLYLLDRPEPSLQYLECARASSRRLECPKRLLIVLDLNGTLMVRSFSMCTPRAHVVEFLAYCFKHHAVAIWSSAHRKNVLKMMGQLFTQEQISQLVAVWSREDCHLNQYFGENVQVYKQLRWLWNDPDVQAAAHLDQRSILSLTQPDLGSAVWDQTNTILVDDSMDKADSEPYNLILVKEFTGNAEDSQRDVLGSVLAYIEDLAWESNVSSAIHCSPFDGGHSLGWNWEIGCPDFDGSERSEAGFVAPDEFEHER